MLGQVASQVLAEGHHTDAQRVHEEGQPDDGRHCTSGQRAGVVDRTLKIDGHRHHEHDLYNNTFEGSENGTKKMYGTDFKSWTTTWMNDALLW